MNLNFKKINLGEFVKNPLFLSVIGATILAAVLIWIISQNVSTINDQKNRPTGLSDKPSTEKIFHPLTGQSLSEPISGPLKVFAVMVENSADAWPLSGVEDAFLVIEAPVEGAIPRFEAFYSSDQSVEEIGPVRSARPYYLDWAEGFVALYAHVGGSPAALESISARSIFDLNEFYQGEYFWRNHNRAAPHNVYTSLALLNAGANEIGAADFTGSWIEFDASASESQRTDGQLTVGTDRGDSDANHKIQIAWPGGGRYTVGWVYDQESKTYRRLQGTAIALSSAGREYRAANVIVIKTAIETIDDIGRRQIATTGEGEALVYLSGQSIVATWKKTSATSPLEFFDQNGELIVFAPGTTWIEVVDDLAIVSSPSTANN